MKKFSILLALAATLLLTPLGARGQNELTVYEGTTTSSYVPAWVYNWDNFSRAQFVIPAEDLSEMTGGNITAVTFYTNSTNIPYTSVSVADLYIMEVDYTTITDYEPKDNIVYSGTFDFVAADGGGMVTIEFETPYTYTGGNLLIGIDNTTDAGWKTINFYGTTVTGASISGYSSTATGSISATARNFIPMTTFTWEAGGSEPTCLKPNNLTLTDTTSEGVTLSWHPRNEESSWHVYVDGTEVDDSPVNDTTYTFTGLTPASLHTVGVAAVCGDDFESGIATKSFRTLCGAIPMPWMEDFNTVSGISSLGCWNIYAGLYNDDEFSLDSLSAASDIWVFTKTNGITSKHAAINIFGSGRHHWLVTPEVAISQDANLMFELALTDYNNSDPIESDTNIADDRFIVFAFNTADSTLTPLAKWGMQVGTRDDYSYAGISTTPESIILSLSNFVGQTVRFAFYGESTVSGGDNDLHIDDIMVVHNNGCFRPASVAVGGVTYEGATVSWTDVDDYVPAGHTVRVATANDVNSATAIDFEDATSPYALTGLSGGTTYYVWVRSECDDNSSTLWRAGGSFTTEEDCYPVLNLRVSDKNMTSAVLTWNMQSRGRECTGVNVTVIDITDATAPDTADPVVVNAEYHFLSGLEGDHTYKVLVAPQCDTYAATAATVTFSTDACGRLQGTTTTSTSPLAGNYKYSYSQTIYPASALQGMSEITAIKFRQASAPSSCYNRIVKVYMANTDATLLDTNDYIDINDLTLYYDGLLNVEQTGWKEITLTEPFVYDGTSNVVVAMLNTTAEYGSFNWGAHNVTDSLGNTVAWRSDAAVISAENPNARIGSSNVLPTRGKSFTVPDITFVGDCSMPTCLAPLAAVSETSLSSITLTWVAGSEETSWVVEYRQYGDTVWTRNDDYTTTTATVNDLQNSTLYEFRVGSLCGDDTLYCTVFRGRTLCGEMTLPYTENFEGWTGTNPFHSCWYKVQAAGNYPYISNTTTYRYSGTGAMYSYANSGQVSLIATPEVPTDPDNIKVTFWAYNWNATSSTTQAGVLTDVNDPSTFVACRVNATGVQQGSMKEYEFYTDTLTELGIATPVHAAFRIASSSAITIDDVTVAIAGFCRRPNTPSVNNVTAYSAMLHWNDINHGASTYQVCYNTEDNLAGATLLDGEVMGDSTEVTGLHNGQTYYMWVRPACSENVDDWLPMPVFTTVTTCYPVTRLRRVGSTNTTAAITWQYSDVQGEGVQEQQQSVVISLMDLADSSWVMQNVAVSGTSYIFTGLTQGGSYMAYIASVCDPDSSAALKMGFGGASAGQACAEVEGTTAYSSNSYVPFTRYFNYAYTQTLYTASELSDISAISGIGYETLNPGDYNFTVDVYVGLTTANSLTTSGVPGNSLTLVAQNVIVNPSEGTVDIMFDQPFAYTSGSNLVVAVVNKTGAYEGGSKYWKSHSTTSTMAVYSYSDTSPYNPSNTTSFSSSSSYRPNTKFYGSCGSGEENDCVAPVLVVNHVGIDSVDLAWGIDNATAPVTVQYRLDNATTWTEEEVQNTQSYTVSGLTPASKYNFRLLYECEGDSLYSNEQILWTECAALDVPQTFTFGSALNPCWVLTTSYVSCSTSVSALYFGSSSSSIGIAVLPEFQLPVTSLKVTVRARSSSTNPDISVGVCDGNGNNYTEVGSASLTSTYTNYTFYLNNYTGSDSRVAITKNNGSTSVYVESIVVEEAESCLPVASLTAADVTDNSATINWSGNGATAFEVEYREASATTWQSVAASGNSATLTGLAELTNYDVRVRAVCSDDDQSIWDTIAFTTAMLAADVPYSTGFETTDDVNWAFANGTNGWAIGTAASNTGSRALYISNDGGTTHNYTTSSATTSSYAYKSFNLGAGQCTVSFDWKADGESTWDFLRAFIAPATAVFEANQTNGIASTTTPDGWIDLGGKLNLQSDWQSLEQSVTIPQAGVYYLVLYWRNDGSGGSQPGAAVDNLSIDGASVQPCDAPVISQASPTENAITLQWTGTAQSYEVASVEGTEWNAPNVGIATSATSYTFSGLSSNTTYTVGVRSVCGSQKSEWVTRQVTTTTPADPTCNVPTNLTATNVTANSATVSWTAGGSETAWVLEVSAAGNATEYEVSGTPSKELTGLDTVTSYTIRVKAVCSETSQSAWSQPELFQTKAGISDVLGESFKLYPNPASVSVTIELGEAGLVSLLDASGREGGKWTTESGRLTIDLSGYASGAYYVRVVTARGTAVRKLIVR